MSAVWDLPAVRGGITAQAASLRRLRDTGAALIGWKVGVGAHASMAAAGIPAPLVGYLSSHTRLESGAALSVSGWHRPMLEPEIAIYLGTDVAGGADPDQARAAIAAIGSAIEMADLDTELSNLEQVVGGNIFHRAVILGEPDGSRAGGRVDDLTVAVQRGDDTVAQTDDVTALTGSPVDLVMHVSSWLAATGQRLEAGQVIISGSVVPIIAVEAGDSVTYRCHGLGVLEVSLTD